MPPSSVKIRPGDVVRVWDTRTHPPKHKRHICVCAEKQLFLRINSSSIFQPHHPLNPQECDFIEHASYVELTNLVRNRAYELQQAEIIGRLRQRIANDLLDAIQAADTLSDDEKDFIRERLTGPGGPAVP